MEIIGYFFTTLILLTGGLVILVIRGIIRGLWYRAVGRGQSHRHSLEWDRAHEWMD